MAMIMMMVRVMVREKRSPSSPAREQCSAFSPQEYRCWSSYPCRERGSDVGLGSGLGKG